jgi:hypothetical protein
MNIPNTLGLITHGDIYDNPKLKCVIFPKNSITLNLWGDINSTAENFVMSIPNVDATIGNGYLKFNCDRLVIPRRIELSSGGGYAGIHISADKLIFNTEGRSCGLEGDINTIVLNSTASWTDYYLLQDDVTFNKIVLSPFSTSLPSFMGVNGNYRHMTIDCSKCQRIPSIPTSSNGYYALDPTNSWYTTVIIPSHLYLDFINSSSWNWGYNINFVCDDIVRTSVNNGWGPTCPKNMTWREYVVSPYGQYDNIILIQDDIVYYKISTSDTYIRCYKLYNMSTRELLNPDDIIRTGWYSYIDYNNDYVEIPINSENSQTPV